MAWQLVDAGSGRTRHVEGQPATLCIRGAPSQATHLVVDVDAVQAKGLHKAGDARGVELQQRQEQEV